MLGTIKEGMNMNTELNIHRYQENELSSNNTGESLNDALLRKILSNTNNIAMLDNLSNKNYYILDSNSNMYGLPGKWETGNFAHNSDCVIKGVNKTITDLTQNDILLVLGVCSLISYEEFPTIFGKNTPSNDLETAAMKVIDDSQTTITIDNGAQRSSTDKVSGDTKGNFDRIDLSINNYNLESNIWDHMPSGGTLNGAYSALYIIINFPEKGNYNLSIRNVSPLFGSTNKNIFDLEVNYKLQIN